MPESETCSLESLQWHKLLREALSTAVSKHGASSALLRSSIKALQPRGPCAIPHARYIDVDQTILQNGNREEWVYTGSVIIDDLPPEDSGVSESSWVNPEELEAGYRITMKEDGVYSIIKSDGQTSVNRDRLDSSSCGDLTDWEILERFKAFEQKMTACASNSNGNRLVPNEVYVYQLPFMDVSLHYIPASRTGKFWLVIPSRDRNKLEFTVAKAFNCLPHCDAFIQHLSPWVCIEKLDIEGIEYSIGFQSPGQTLLVLQGATLYGIEDCYDGSGIGYMGCVKLPGAASCAGQCHGGDCPPNQASNSAIDATNLATQQRKDLVVTSKVSSPRLSSMTEVRHPSLSLGSEEDKTVAMTPHQLATPRPTPNRQQFTIVRQAHVQQARIPSNLETDDVHVERSRTVVVPSEERTPSKDTPLLFDSDGGKILQPHEMSDTGDLDGIQETTPFMQVTQESGAENTESLDTGIDEIEEFTAKNPLTEIKQALPIPDIESTDVTVPLSSAKSRLNFSKHSLPVERQQTSARAVVEATPPHNLPAQRQRTSARTVAKTTQCERSAGHAKLPRARIARTTSVDRIVDDPTRETPTAVDRKGTEDDTSSPGREVSIGSDKILKDKLIHGIEDNSTSAQSAHEVLDGDLTEQATADALKHGLQGPVCNIDAITRNGSEGDKLSATVEYCKAAFVSSCFTPSEGRADYVPPDEINHYFRTWFDGKPSTSMIMQVLYLLDFGPNVFVASSEDAILNSQRKPRWPGNSTCVILPSCHQEHWTLFCVDTVAREIFHYDSNAGATPQAQAKRKQFQSNMKAHIKKCIHADYRRAAIYSVHDAPSLQQKNDIDCGLFVLRNAESFAKNANDISDDVSGEELRVRYLRMCIEAHNRNQLNRTLETAVFGKSVCPRKRKRLEDSDPEATEEDYASDVNDHCALSVGKGATIDSWTTECENLTQELKLLRPRAHKVPDLEATQAEAKSLMAKVQAVGCEDVLSDLKKMDYNHRMCSSPNSTAATIAGLIKQATKRLFRDHILLRIGLTLLLQDINHRLERIRKNGPTPTQFLVQGYAITRAYDEFVAEAYPNLGSSERNEHVKAYRKWAVEGKIWFQLFHQFGLAILLLIPAGHRNGGVIFYNSCYTKLPVWQHNLFVRSLHQFRPDLNILMGALKEVVEIIAADLHKVLLST